MERIIERPMRRRLPDTRRSVTHRFNVAGHEGYLTVGLYEDGSPGELFITMSKEGSTIGGLMDSLGTAISVALQYGVPVESLVKKFEHQRFEPMGMTANRDIPFAKSLVDYIFRWLGMEFIEGYREANAPRRKGGTTKRKKNDSSTADASLAVTEDRTWSEQDGNAKGPDTTAPPRSERVKTDEAGRSAGATTTTKIHTDALIVESDVNGSARMTAASSDLVAVVSALDRSNAALQGDAPACEVCGSITVRNATCYRCLNCGNSMGCS